MADIRALPLLMVFLGGGVGSVLRFIISRFSQHWFGAYPYGTLAANLLGAFMAGMAMVFIFQKRAISAPWSDLALAGFLGGLTTFSSMVLDAYQLMLGGHWPAAVFYILLNLVLGFLLFHIAFSMLRIA